MEIILYTFLLSILFIFLILSLVFSSLFLLNLIIELKLFFKNYSPFVPTSVKKYNKEFEELFEFLNTLNLSNKKFVDLGSGTGDIVLMFAKKGYESYGIELNPCLVFISKLRAKKMKNVAFIRNDFFEADLRDFRIVYVYQLTPINKKLFLKFQDELESGSIIISHKFAFPESDKIKLIKNIKDNIFLIYQII